MTATARELARTLIDAELAGGRGPQEQAVATQRVCAKLSSELEELVGRDGARAILNRALSKARAGFPFLVEVTLAAQGEPQLTGLSEAVKGQEPKVADDGLSALIEEVIGLVASLIRMHLTLQLVRSAWPELLLDTGDASAEGEGN